MNTLPLLDTRDRRRRTVRRSTPKRAVAHGSAASDLVETRAGHGACPTRAPGPGEQYRFHFDMGQCIGCKCCVVACNEQNGNPGRRSTGGAWARSRAGCTRTRTRSYLSMGCNHCVDPTCLERVPGRRVHQGSSHRHRAATARTPASAASTARGTVRTACRSTTPSAASSASATCATDGSNSVSRRPVSARVPRAPSRSRSSTSPTGGRPLTSAPRRAGRARRRRQPVDDAHHDAATLPPNARPIDLTHVRPAEPHWPLVVMTVLTQLSVGAFAAIWLLQLAGASTRSWRGGADVARGRRPGAWRLDAAPRASDPRLSRAEDVAALVAQPRGAAVLGVLRRRELYAGAAVDARVCDRVSATLGGLTVLCGLAGVTRQRVHLPRCSHAPPGTRR